MTHIDAATMTAFRENDGRPLCERCGKPGNVQVASVPTNRDGVIQRATEHRYCRDCAREVGVPLPERRARVPDEHAPPNWADLREFYEMVARIPLSDSAQRADVASDAADMLRMLEFLPEKAPPELRALLERIAGRTP